MTLLLTDDRRVYFRFLVFRSDWRGGRMSRSPWPTASRVDLWKAVPFRSLTYRHCTLSTQHRLIENDGFQGFYYRLGDASRSDGVHNIQNYNTTTCRSNNNVASS